MGGQDHGSCATDRGSIDTTEQTGSQKAVTIPSPKSCQSRLIACSKLHGMSAYTSTCNPELYWCSNAKREALVSRHTVAVTPSTQLTALATQSLHILAPQVTNSSSATSASVANKLSCRTTAGLIRRSTPRSSQRPGEHVYTAGPNICASSIYRGHGSC
jgi:hypothetical protein